MMNDLKKKHLIRASRISLAMLISFIYIRTVYVSDGIWVIMTCAIVLFDNATVGGALTKGYYRLLGTLVAAAFSILVVVMFANSTIANLLAIAISVFIAGYYFMDTKVAYIGGIIAWTTPIMLVNNHNLMSIFIRPLNIMVGIIIAYIVQRIFFPEYARDQVLAVIGDLLNKALELLNAALTLQHDDEVLEFTHEKMEIGIIANINKALRLVDEVNVELRNTPEYGMKCDKLIIHLRRIFKYIGVFTHQIQDKVITLSPELKKLLEQLIKILQQMDLNLKSIAQVDSKISEFISIKSKIQILQEKYFVQCQHEQTLMLQMMIQELFASDQLMLDLYELREKYKIY